MLLNKGIKDIITEDKISFSNSKNYLCKITKNLVLKIDF